ncbi:oligosaccharide flippase family protein [Desulfosporosinus sp. BG]|uniref:lipopolysaccharide biosynthesis protein n=1 Tax=Desulfosporosinus sp. BG TaxID=1633135 RepID=UPI00114C8E54|nr:oligosaccharide flippase family protein [Desulfosporosinus sp. BG]
MSRENSLVKNTFVLSIGVFLPKVVAFITLPILTAYLTQAEYGTYDLVTILATLLLPAVTLQIQTAAFRFLIDNRNNEEKVKGIVTNIYAFILPISFITLVILFFILPTLSVLTRLLLCLYFASDILENAARQIIRGLANNKDYSVSAIISAVGKMIFAVIMVWYFRTGLIGALVCLFVASFCSLAYLCSKAKILKYINIKYISLNEIKHLVQYSWPMVPNSLSMWVMSVSDRLIVTFVLGVEINAIYSVANKIPSILSLARSTFTMAWQENASIASKDEDATQYYSFMYDTVVGIMSGCLALLIACTPILFAVLIHGDYDAAYYQMPILFVATLLDSLASFLGGVYVAFKKTASVGITTMAAAVLNLLINCLLINRIGLYAASLSTVISYFLLVAFRMINVRKITNITYNYKKIMFCGASILFMCVLCYQRSTLMNIINALIGVVLFVFLNKSLICVFFKKLKIN